jgi:hypothetical protein
MKLGINHSEAAAPSLTWAVFVFKAGHYRPTGIDISSLYFPIYHTTLTIHPFGESHDREDIYIMTRVLVYTAALAAFITGKFTISSPAAATACLQ